MKVKVIPVLEDNYMYLVIEELTREAVAVDVAVPKRVRAGRGPQGRGRVPREDHARGNPELARLRPGLAVLGADERIFSLTRRLAHGEELRFGAIHVRCLLTAPTPPPAGPAPSALTRPPPPGDALSVAGCGSCLEGSAQQMYQSLAELGTLPPETKVFCGHEHTLSNLEFAQKVEPCNDHVRAKLSWAKARPLPGGAGGRGFGGGALRQGLMVTGACGHSRRGMRMTCPQCRRLWARSASTTPSCGWREYGCCSGASTVTWTLRKASRD
uniref:Hydroxyacylglutathione hydrolase like n=1 Tax=Gorilla gorilla gorilla TaxID=9595 RepID=G3RDI9_GORGO